VASSPPTSTGSTNHAMEQEGSSVRNPSEVSITHSLSLGRKAFFDDS